MKIKNKSSFLLIAILFAASISCNKDKDPVAGCHILTQQNSSGTFTYRYDGGKVVGLISTTSAGTLATTFDYGDDKLVKVEEAQLSNNGTVSNLTYLDGKIVKQEWFTSTNLLTDRQEYEYSGNQLVKIQEYVDSRTGFVKSEYRVLEYSDDTNNPSRVTYFNADNTTNFTAEYTYGDKHAATGAVPPEFLAYEMLDGLSQDKNVLQIVFSTGTEIDYTYEFNESGYPTKRTETYSTGQVNIQTNTFDCK